MTTGTSLPRYTSWTPGRSTTKTSARTGRRVFDALAWLGAALAVLLLLSLVLPSAELALEWLLVW